MRYSLSFMLKRWVCEYTALASERDNCLCFDHNVAGDVYHVPANDWHNDLYDDNDNDMEMRERLSFNNHHRRSECYN